MPCLPALDVHALDASCLRLHRFSRRKTRSLLAMLAMVLPVAANAAVTNYIWDGGATGLPRWGRAGNWNATNTAPPANQIGGLTNTDITFAGTVRTTPLMENAYFIRTLVFATNASSFNLLSLTGQPLTIGSGGIVNYSANAQSIGSSLSLSNAQTWNALAGDLNIRGQVNLGANALTLDGARNTAISNTIRGTGSLLKQGAGNLILAGTAANTFSGGVTLSGGTITVAKSNALGSGPLVLNSGTLNLGAYNLSASSVSLLGGTVTSTSGALNASAYLLQSGTVSARLGGSAVLTKSTPGVVTLTSSNLYTGGTLITGGRLTVNNLTGSGTGSGNVRIGSGGTLTGTGAISGIVTNGPGGTLSAGDIIGQMNLGGGVWLGGATNRWEINDAAATAGVGWDLLNFTGGLTISATSSDKAFIDVVSFTLGNVAGQVANFDPSQSYLWKILQTGSGITFAPGEDELTVFGLLTGSFANAVDGGTFGISRSNGGRDLNLTFTPSSVPEPSHVAFATLCVCGFIYGRRFKQNWGPSGR